jgi:glycosyltransferase involved in cell wall biosynthesis
MKAEQGQGRPLRLVMATPRFFPNIGGVETHVYQVARHLAQRGIAVTVLTTDRRGKHPARELSDGITIRRVRAQPADRDWYFAPDVYRIITREPWDLVHVQSYHTFVAPLAMLAAWRSHIPYVVTFHGGGHSSRLRNALRGVQWALLRPLLARAERLIAVARFEIKFFGEQLRLPPERFVFIPNGANLPKVACTASLTATNGTLIASVGRLERYKGHHRIIAALPYILEQRPDVRLWVAGAGPYEPTLRHLAERLGVTKQVEIRSIPATERETMATELSQAALVVLLSEYETHPIAVLEALALGRPVLVADTSGLSELAERGLARAIPLHSTAEQVAAAVLDQFSQPLVPPSIDLPTWDECAAGLLALYQTISRRPLCAS